MKNKIIFMFIGVVVGLIAIGVLAQLVGRISLRSYTETDSTVDIMVGEPVMRGVPVTVQIESTKAWPALDIEWRTTQAILSVGTVLPDAQTALIKLPCDTATQGSLVLRTAKDGHVIAQKAVTAFPPGVDCAW